MSVFVRVRPPKEERESNESRGQNLGRLTFDAGGQHVTQHVGRKHIKKFTFDRVFGEQSTQVQVFNHVGRTVVDGALQGFNGSIFAYGQTGSGKTHTMLGCSEHKRPSGPEDSTSVDEFAGVIPRVLEYLFSELALRDGRTAAERHGGNETQFSVKVSYLEIYRENILDLLCSDDEEGVNLSLRQDASRGAYVENLTEINVTSPDEALGVMAKGNSRRKTFSTRMNKQSSRSHAVFTVYVEGLHIDAGTGIRRRRFSRINLVDLAGSERQRSTGQQEQD